MTTSDIHPTSGQALSGRGVDARATRAARRRSISLSLHRAALWLTLAVGGGALVYNALSVVTGQGGLANVSAPFEQGRFLSAVDRFGHSH
jgi:hypothetical protein